MDPKELLPSYSQMYSYVLGQFSLSYELPELRMEDFYKLHISKEDEINQFINLFDLKPVSFFDYKGYQVPVFFASDFVSPLENNSLQFDFILNSFLLLSGWQEWLVEKKDKEGRFPFTESLQYKFCFAEVPVVTIYFELFAKALKANGIPCSEKKFEQPIVFTHDIDQLRSGWYEDIGFYIKNPSLKNGLNLSKSLFTKIFGLQDSYSKAFEEMLAIDEEHQTKAISFLMTEKSHEDADYSFSALQNFKKLHSQRLGLHPGYFTFNNEENFTQQLAVLQNSFPGSEKIIRQHFLKYDVKITNQIHENLAITADYSLGFAEQYGFRNSIASPFYLYRFDEKRASNVLEIPLYFMDGTLHHYLKDSSWEGKQKVVQAIQQLTTNFNCQFSVLFHNSVFTENKYKGFKEMYKLLISKTDVFSDKSQSSIF